MKVNIKRIDKSLPLPVYETRGSVGFDLLCRTTTEIAPVQIGLIPSNVVIQTPPGYMLLVTLRSSTPKRKGLLKPHGVGIIDQDYCGNNDEIMIQVFNFSEETTQIDRGEKIGQGIFVRIEQFEWEEVDDMQCQDRGGFGSTTRHH
ncbi:dUTP diphosphatase [candidate division KSB1 bacterium]|nr:dUTP diphosphatase [candidate division KSB1 bacterium]